MAEAGVSRPLKPEGPFFTLYRSHSKCFRVIRTQGADVRCLMFRHVDLGLINQINLVIGTTYQVQGSKVNGTAAIKVRGETRKNYKVIIPAATFHVSRFGYRYVTDSTYSIHYEVFYLDERPGGRRSRRQSTIIRNLSCVPPSFDVV